MATESTAPAVSPDVWPALAVLTANNALRTQLRTPVGLLRPVPAVEGSFPILSRATSTAEITAALIPTASLVQERPAPAAEPTT